MLRQSHLEAPKIMTGFAARFIAAQAIPSTIEGVAAYFRTLEEEETKRQAIAANRDVLVARINAERDAILAYFGHRFAERRAALDEFFELLRHATIDGDNERLVAALGGILGIIQQNPLDDFETFKHRLQNPDYVIEI